LFYDKVRAGQRWQERPREELTGCWVVLALLSRDWLGSPWCDSDIPGSRAVAISPHTGAPQIRHPFLAHCPVVEQPPPVSQWVADNPRGSRNLGFGIVRRRWRVISTPSPEYVLFFGNDSLDGFHERQIGLSLG
jgi:hypothetical protein